MFDVCVPIWLRLVHSVKKTPSYPLDPQTHVDWHTPSHTLCIAGHCDQTRRCRANTCWPAHWPSRTNVCTGGLYMTYVWFWLYPPTRTPTHLMSWAPEEASRLHCCCCCLLVLIVSARPDWTKLSRTQVETHRRHRGKTSYHPTLDKRRVNPELFLRI